MKKIFRFGLILVAVIAISTGTSCIVVNRTASQPAYRIESRGHVPPGQMKKATGERSAKAYAPGQQKKKKNKR